MSTFVTFTGIMHGVSLQYMHRPTYSNILEAVLKRKECSMFLLLYMLFTEASEARQSSR